MKTLNLSIMILMALSTLLVPPMVSADKPCTDMQSNYVKMNGGSNANWRIAGEAISFNGNIQSLSSNTLKGKLLIYSDPPLNGRWKVIGHDPVNDTFEIPTNSTTRYSITVQSLLPGKYHIYPTVYLFGIGQASVEYACTSNFDFTIVGKPICAQNLVPISKAEDGSYYCVTQETAQILKERGWAGNSLLVSMFGSYGGGGYRNGAWNMSYNISVNLEKPYNGEPSLLFQTFYPNGTLFKSDTVTPDNIPQDGFYMYSLSVKSDKDSDKEFKLVVTYGTQTRSIGLPSLCPCP